MNRIIWSKYVSNVFAFVGLFIVVAALQDYVFRFEQDAAIMIYGWATLNLVSWIVDNLFNYKQPNEDNKHVK